MCVQFYYSNISIVLKIGFDLESCICSSDFDLDGYVGVLFLFQILPEEIYSKIKIYIQRKELEHVL